MEKYFFLNKPELFWYKSDYSVRGPCKVSLDVIAFAEVVVILD